MPKVTIYSRPACCLCEEVKQQLEDLRRRIEFDIEVINIDEDQALRRLYSDDVPVVMIDGKKAFEHRLDADRFLELLAASWDQS
jgi:glutaredoxin